MLIDGSELKLRFPSLKIIILTMHKEADIIRSVMARGIDGYVFKDDAVNDVVMVIQEVMNGKQYISKSTSLFSDELNTDLMGALTKSELLVLRAIANHKTSPEIADTLFVSIKTVENHRNNISRKLNLQGTQLDSATYKFMTKTGAVLPILGNNQTWDYSALKDSLPAVNTYYREPVAGFGTIPAAFSDATYAFNYNIVFQAFSYPGVSTLYINGVLNNTHANTTNTALTYLPAAPVKIGI